MATLPVGRSLFSELAKNSILLRSLHGVRTVLERELDIKGLLISTDETIKQDLAREGRTTYPYAYLVLSELISVKDQGANRVMQRHGVRMGLTGASMATTRKGYLFPINLGIELKYVDSNPVTVLTMAESMVLLSSIGGLSFQLSLAENLKFPVRLEIPENVSIPVGATSSTESPGGLEVSLSIVVHTYTGFFREVQAVNSGSASISMEVLMDREGATPIVTTIP